MPRKVIIFQFIRIEAQMKGINSADDFPLTIGYSEGKERKKKHWPCLEKLVYCLKTNNGKNISSKLNV